jgi:hypothetical protein
VDRIINILCPLFFEVLFLWEFSCNISAGALIMVVEGEGGQEVGEKRGSAAPPARQKWVV